MNNDKLLERRHFLLRAMRHKNIDPVEAKAEIRELDLQISKNTKARLDKAYTELQSRVQEVKKTVFFDGDFKRTIANMLIEILQEELDKEAIKGVLRQGYLIMRSRC